MHKIVYRWEIINQLIQARNYHSYLEIGVDKFETFNIIQAPSKECVDPNVSNATHYTTSDIFFEHAKDRAKMYDLIFIDGLHTYEQSWRDLQNALELLSMDGTIVLHDCNPQSAEAANPEWIPGYWLGEVWKTILSARVCFPNVYVGVVPDDQGCGLVTSMWNPIPLRQDLARLSLEQIRALPYSFLDYNRKEILNLWEQSFSL